MTLTRTNADSPSASLAWKGRRNRSRKDLERSLFLSYLKAATAVPELLHHPPLPSFCFFRNSSKCLLNQFSMQEQQSAALSVPLDAFLLTGKADRILLESFSGTQHGTAWSCEETCPRVHKGLRGLPRAGHKHRGLPATPFITLMPFNPLNFSLPQTKSILVTFKRISCVC